LTGTPVPPYIICDQILPMVGIAEQHVGSMDGLMMRCSLGSSLLRKTNQIFALPGNSEQQATSPSISRCSTSTPELPWLRSCPSDGSMASDASDSTPPYQHGGCCGNPPDYPNDEEIASLSTPHYAHGGWYGHPSSYLKVASACASDGACTPHSPRMAPVPCINLESVCVKLQHLIDERLQEENRQDLSPDADFPKKEKANMDCSTSQWPMRTGNLVQTRK